MRFKSIHLVEGSSQRYIEFSNSANLIFSEKNSTGKTTLLRLLLYGIGYQIPSTQGLKFSKCKVVTIIESEDIEYRIDRQKDYLEVSFKEEKEYYILPHDLYIFHSLIFNTNNPDILNNILGAIYMDQEKGWTLLNRGTVIGKIKFSIEELIRGLSDKECNNMMLRLDSINKELDKYKQMYNIALYKKEINELSNNIVYDNYTEELNKKLANHNLELVSLENELKRVNNVIDNNEKFKNYIEKMNLTVKCPNGDEIPVKEDNIVGFSDNTRFLLEKRKMIANNLSIINSRIDEIEFSIRKDNALVETESIIQVFDKLELEALKAYKE